MNIEQQNTELMQRVQNEINKMENTMSHFYAQLNEDNIVVGVSELDGPVDYAHMIPIDSFDQSLLGKLWTGTEFIENPNPPVIPEPTA